MSAALIEPHYLPSLEFFCAVNAHKTIYWNRSDTFQKQTFRNRCQVLASDGVHNLIVPVSYHTGDSVGQVRIDNRQSWVRDHKGAFYSLYGRAPFFEYYADRFHRIWDTEHEWLIDLNRAMLSVCMELLEWQHDIQFIDSADDLSAVDLRNQIIPKKSFENRGFYQPVAYLQIFGKGFVNNLSILDLLMCTGPEARSVIRESAL